MDSAPTVSFPAKPWTFTCLVLELLPELGADHLPGKLPPPPPALPRDPSTKSLMREAPCRLSGKKNKLGKGSRKEG